MRSLMIHFFRILLFISIYISFFSSWAQDIWVTLDYQTTNTGDNGLIGQFTMSFMQDHQGRIWIGTESGISIKDGSSWSSITTSDGLKENEVGNIVEGKDSSIWIGYGSYVTGISSYRDGKFTHYHSGNGLTHDKTEDIFRDNQNNIWVATQGGMDRFDGETWHRYPIGDGFASNYPTSISEDTLGNIWFGTKGDGLWFYDGANFIKHSESGGPNGIVNEVFIDHNNRIWIYTSTGVYMRDQVWSKISSYNDDFGVVRDINQDIDGTIYFMSHNGVYTVNSDFQITHFTTEHGIPHNSTLTSSLMNGMIFVGTEDGYAYFDGVGWKSNLTSENGLIHNEVNDIFRDSKGNLWFCTLGGISKYDGNLWESYRRTPDGHEIEWVTSGLQDGDGNYWFTTVYGIFRFDGEQWQIFDYNDSEVFNGWGQDIIEDRLGNIWVATFNYLLKYDGSIWTHYNASHGFLNNHVDAVYEDTNGKIWIGSRSQISTWDGENFQHMTPFEIYQNEELAINSFLEDSSGQVVASTYNGNFIFSDEAWKYFDSSPSMWYFDSFIDKNNIMWFASISGLLKYDGISYKLFDTSDGLAAEVVYSVYRDEFTGELWIGTNQGITHILPDIEVTDIEVTDTYLRVASQGISQPFHYSIDGSNFDNVSGEIALEGEDEFALHITNAYDTVVYENVRIQSITSLEIPEDQFLMPSPNPSDGLFEVSQKGLIKIFNTNGRIIYEGMNREDHLIIDIRDKKNGLYIIQVIEDQHLKMYKFLKK